MLPIQSGLLDDAQKRAALQLPRMNRNTHGVPVLAPVVLVTSGLVVKREPRTRKDVDDVPRPEGRKPRHRNAEDCA